MSDVLKISTPTGDDEANQIADAKALAEKKARITQLEKSNADLEKLIAQKGGGGAPAREGMRKNAEYKAVSTAPSINKTPRGRSTPRLPYPTVQDLSNSEAIVPTVTLNGDPAYVLNQTVQPSCKGDDPGTALGVKSGTVNGYVKPTGASSTVTMGGQPAVRIGDPCVMNGGNNPGIYVTAEPASANPAKSAASTSNPSSGQGQDDVPPGMRTSEKLDALKKQKAALQAQRLNYDALDEYVNFGEANNGLDTGIASIQGTKGTWTDSAAQGTRGVLGFVKDAVTGIGELAYEGIKGVPKLVDGATTEAGQQISQINGQILAENIRLGNITPGTIGQGAQNIGSALVKPVTAPWRKGNYVEALARGATEVGTLFSGTIAKVGKLGGAAKLGEAADAVKAAEAAKIADAADAAKAADAADAAKGSKAGEAKPPESPGDGVVVKPAKPTKPPPDGFKTYETHGYKGKTTDTPEGRRLVEEFKSQGYSAEEATKNAKRLMETGNNPPLANPTEIGDRLYKVVPEGKMPGAKSEFWSTRQEIDSLHGMSRDAIADKLGLPLESQQAPRFDVVEIKATQPTTTFSSRIAPTSQNGWIQDGGKIQTLVTDRSAFTPPVSTGIKLP